jgi:nicotinamide-nucleotide amidase
MSIHNDNLDKLAEELGALLKRHSLMLATAESCTGGWISMLVTSVAGSSDWFDRGFVTYSNVAKQDMLGVRAETIEIHGAVSEQTAREMALGAIENSQAGVAVSVTGIAGPGGGSENKPVGTVCFGWAINGGCETTTCHFKGDRTEIREQSAEYALQGLMERLHD